MCLYLSYRMRHVRSGGFWRWSVGWASFGYFTIVFAMTRIRIVLAELSGEIPFDGKRFGLVFSGSCGLLIFILSLRWSFPNGDRTLWDDLRADATRLSAQVRHTAHRIRRRTP
jgi:hypothetical protein